MLLDRIDIDTHGPLQRVELGPFSEQINVVTAPEGSGKTALTRFLRDALVDRTYPVGMLSSSTGRIVFAGRDGLVHYYREQDGTSKGRRTVEYESRGSQVIAFDVAHPGWLHDISQHNDATRAIQSLKLPEAIADCVITDTALTSVARVVSACVRSGLDCRETHGSLLEAQRTPFEDRSPDVSSNSRDSHSIAATRAQTEQQQYSDRQLRSELADVEAELASIHAQTGRLDDLESESLLSRRHWLTQCLANASRVPVADDVPAKPYPNNSNPKQSSATKQGAELHQSDGDRKNSSYLRTRLRELHAHARNLRAKQNQLRSWINELGQKQSQWAAASNRTQSGPHNQTTELHQQLEDIDAQLVHWQRGQMEIRELQNCLLTGKSSALTSHPPVDERSLRRMRVDGFLHSIERYQHSKPGEHIASEPSRPAQHLDAINQHIHVATRQIEWLVDRYAGNDRATQAWYEQDQSIPGTATTLSATLQTICDVLRQIRTRMQSHAISRSPSPAHDLSLARRCEQSLSSAIRQLNRHRAELNRQDHSTGNAEDKDSATSQHQLERWHRERADRVAELESVTLSLDICLSEAAEVRRNMRATPSGDLDAACEKRDWLSEERESTKSNRAVLVKELQELDDRITSFSRIQWLKTRRTQILNQLGFPFRTMTPSSPLAHEASRWLVRLTGGRLQRLDWSTEEFTTNRGSTHEPSQPYVGVTIDGREETECPPLDRACAVTAVRMAAGDFLARTGRHVPLVIETHAELSQSIDQATDTRPGSPASHQHDPQRGLNTPYAAALRDYATEGRQILILTSSQSLTAQLARVGSRIEKIHAERTIHPHRPLWKPSYANERYVGPHPHTYGLRDVPDQVFPQKGSSNMPNVNANRYFDMAWQDPSEMGVNAGGDASKTVHSESTDWASDGSEHRDGYYYTDTFSTVITGQEENAEPEHHGMFSGQRPLLPRTIHECQSTDEFQLQPPPRLSTSQSTVPSIRDPRLMQSHLPACGVCKSRTLPISCNRIPADWLMPWV